MTWVLSALSLVAGLAAAGITNAWAGVPAAGAFSGAIYALVIGIDTYQSAPPLHGAANDARDIAAALRKGGAKDIRLLLDGAATRDAIMAAWDALMAEAPAGSTLIWTYAGHGSQAPERVKGSEATGMDSFLVLPAFTPQGPATHQKIIDDEIGVMLDKAKAFHVILAVDACHSGSMTRGFDPRADKPTVRAATFGPIDDDPLVVPDPAAAALQISDLKHVTYFGAVPDTEEAPEVQIDNQPRGALSWALARALEGAADANGDGVTTEEELERFIRENIRMKVAGLQHPQVTRGGLGAALALPIGLPVTPAAAPAVTVDPATRVPLTIINQGGLDVQALYGVLRDIQPVDRHAPGRFTWDVGANEVIDSVGDVVARLGRGDTETALARVQGVVDKWRLLQVLEHDAERRSLTVTLSPNDRIHREGERLTLSISDATYPYFTLLNLASDGTVNFLYPIRVGETPDAPTIPLDKPYQLALEVTPPLGADHFIAIAGTQALPGLHEALKALDGKAEAAEVGRLLALHLKGQTYQLGVHGMYTGPK